MKFATISKSLVMGLALLLASSAFAANKATLTLTDPASVNGTKLKAGEYKLQWDGTGSVEVSIVQGKNVRNVNGFQPPCPPPGATPHHYIFEMYALDTKLDLPAGTARADLLKAMDGHVIGKATYVGLYGR